MTGITRSIQNAIRVRRENLGPTGVTPFSAWIPTPVDEIVTALPLAPEAGYRVIWEVAAETSGSPSGSASGSASAASGSPSGSASASGSSSSSVSASDSPAADNRIYEWNGESWQVDPMTDPLTDGLAVTVITSPNGSNRIYIYSQAQDQWIDRTADVSIENGRFYTTWTNGKRYAYPTTVSSVLELTQAGMYVVGDFLEDMPLFPGGITEVGDKSLVETIAYDANNAVLRLYHLRTGKNYTRSKVGGTWGEWIEQAEAYPLPNAILSTMGVVWSGTGYVFHALFTRYRFDQQIWLANGGVTQEITLAAANPDNNRFDTFYVNNAGEWVVLQGDAAVDPIVKMPDPAIGLYVTHVLVTANTIEPPDLPQGLIYDEAAVGEWAVTNVGGTLDDEATTDPEHGTYHIAWTSLQNGNTLSLAKGSTENLATYETLRLGIQLLAGMLNQHGLFVSFWLAGVQNSTEVQVPMAKNSVGSWQIVAMALSAFTFSTATPQADTIRFRWYKGGQADTHAGLYLDYIKLEGGIVPPVVATSIDITGEVVASGQTGTPFPSIINEGTASETLADADTFLVRISTVLRKITWGSMKTLIGTLISGAITAFAELLGEMAWEDDATADGKTYGRKDGAWAEVEGGYEPKKSIQLDDELGTEDNKLQLVGDEASPGNSKYYGTDGAGAKGFHDLPAGGGYEPYETLIITSSATTWDAATGLNKKITTAADFTLTISNVANGMSGALALTISAETTITLSTSLTELGNGSLESLAAGNYVFAFIYDGSVFYYNIAKYE